MPRSATMTPVHAQGRLDSLPGLLSFLREATLLGRRVERNRDGPLGPPASCSRSRTPLHLVDAQHPLGARTPRGCSITHSAKARRTCGGIATLSMLDDASRAELAVARGSSFISAGESVNHEGDPRRPRSSCSDAWSRRRAPRWFAIRILRLQTPRRGSAYRMGPGVAIRARGGLPLRCDLQPARRVRPMMMMKSPTSPATSAMNDMHRRAA